MFQQSGRTWTSARFFLLAFIFSFLAVVWVEPVACGDLFNAPRSGAPPVRRLGRAPEFPAGRLHEDAILDRAIDYLGSGYRELSPGRYLSADGLRQFRYGAHEVRNAANHHAHFEVLDEFGRVIENSVVEIFR